MLLGGLVGTGHRGITIVQTLSPEQDGSTGIWDVLAVRGNEDTVAIFILVGGFQFVLDIPTFLVNTDPLVTIRIEFTFA